MSQEAKYFVAFVPPALVQHPELSLGAKVAAVALLMHHNRTSGLCYPTEENLANELGVTTRSIISYLQELREHVGLTWEPRKAPRGTAKRRGNLYDVTGLIDLCAVPIRTAEEVAEVKKATPTPLVTSERRGENIARRDVKETTPHESEIRATEGNSRKIGSLSHGLSTERHGADPVSNPDNGEVLQPAIEGGEVKKTTPHSARIEQGRTTDRLAGLSARQIQEQFLAPDGSTFFEDDYDGSAWSAAKAAVKLAGGEGFNPGSLQKAIDEYSDGVV